MYGCAAEIAWQKWIHILYSRFSVIRPTESSKRRKSERWQSGRMYLTRNQAYAQAYRGFESHPLRQEQENARASGHFSFVERSEPIVRLTCGIRRDSLASESAACARVGESHPLRQEQENARASGHFSFESHPMGWLFVFRACCNAPHQGETRFNATGACARIGPSKATFARSWLLSGRMSAAATMTLCSAGSFAMKSKYFLKFDKSMPLSGW